MERFNLDEAIAIWKKDLWKQQGLEPGYIEEIECNLRDRIDDYLGDDLSEEQAFELAKEKSLHNPEMLADEYFRASTNRNITPPWKRSTSLLSIMPINFKIAIRNLIKRKVYSTLNILGLAMSIAISFLLWLYVQDQDSYDQHFENADRIYRVDADFNVWGKRDIYSNAPRPVAPSLKEYFPEVEQAIRISGITHTNTLVVGDKHVNTSKIFTADAAFFEVFKYKLVKGNAKKALVAPNSLVITESLAKKIFGDTEVLGKLVQLSGDSSKTLEVTGVIEDNIKKTHLEVEALVSWATFASEGDLTQWYGDHVYTYILLNDNNDIDRLLLGFSGFYNKYFKNTFENHIQGESTANLIYQPLGDIYLDSEYLWEPYPHGSRINVQILSLVMISLLVIAGINYVNLATARSAERAGEVGIRKTLGSSKGLLFAQFMSESVFITLFSGIVAVFLSLLLLPYFNNLSGMHLDVGSFLDIKNIAYVLLLSVFIGLLAGIYPAFFMISFEPVKVLKGKLSTNHKGEWLRKTLVIGQYGISSVLIVGIILVAEQTIFIKNKDIGFNAENVIAINIPKDVTVTGHINGFKESIKNESFVVGITSSENSLSSSADQWIPEFEGPDSSYTVTTMDLVFADYDFVKTVCAKILEGRDFDVERGESEVRSFLINEAAVKEYGWQDSATEMKFQYDVDDEGNSIYWNVIGVVSDFNIGESYQTINPLMICVSQDNSSTNMYIRVKGDHLIESITEIEDSWKKSFPGSDFDYRFLDEELATLYSKEENFLRLLTSICMVIIFLTSLGIVGLISFTTEMKKKEIAIRKISGSTVRDIMLLLTKKFATLLIIGNLIAIPAGYYLIKEWLANFAQRIELSIWPFALSLLICIVFTVFALIYHTMRSARENPIVALQYE